jgi:hypothetical protein
MFSITIRRGNPAHDRLRGPTARRVEALVRPAAAGIFRVLVFLLVGSLGLCAGLMCLTGRYDVGSLVIGSVLFMSLAAANWAR